MATNARTQQAHEKQVQKIVEEAADQIAADSPIEEEVVVSVEELPPGQRRATRTSLPKDGAEAVTNTVMQSAAKSVEVGQQLAADSFNAWIDFTKSVFQPGEVSRLMHPKAVVESSFRFAEELLAVQKEFTLRMMDALPVPK
jgi:hypothetical protein